MSCIRKKYDFYHKIFKRPLFLPISGAITGTACFLPGTSAKIAENLTACAIWVITRMPFFSLAFTIAAYLCSSVRHCNIPVITVADFPPAAGTTALVTCIFSCSAAANTINCSPAAAKCTRVRKQQTKG